MKKLPYDLYNLANAYQETGSGMIGKLSVPMDEPEFLNHIKKEFNLKLIRHTALLGKKIEKVAVCGEPGAFSHRLPLLPERMLISLQM
jgi:putative NIF3 family GTP cyclohydrolase 1 type 2